MTALSETVTKGKGSMEPTEQLETKLRGGGAARTVIVADDDPEQRSLLGDYLREAGWRVLLAADGHEALRLAREQRPDALVLDGVMPGLDGWQVLGRLGADPELASVPVVLTSGYGRSVSRRTDVVFMPKPLDLKRLSRAIRGLVENPRATPLVPFPAVTR